MANYKLRFSATFASPKTLTFVVLPALATLCSGLKAVSCGYRMPCAEMAADETGFPTGARAHPNQSGWGEKLPIF
ncbi:MAG: hypothetical protein A6F72_09470 [Cycloclasticus sp. symbiont of Poecilosclerida sp. N]|nr:MAG: hypothetical protein A6F72_09470 [Cycloclasticus sp. symbiont of Poecilosclerida sp. N]